MIIMKSMWSEACTIHIPMIVYFEFSLLLPQYVHIYLNLCYDIYIIHTCTTDWEIYTVKTFLKNNFHGY